MDIDDVCCLLSGRICCCSGGPVDSAFVVGEGQEADSGAVLPKGGKSAVDTGADPVGFVSSAIASGGSSASNHNAGCCRRMKT
jgi:hypothetical protein